MDNEQIVDAVAPVSQAKPPRWLDNLFFSIGGKLVTVEDRAEDKLVLQRLNVLKVTTEQELASSVGVPADNKKFLKSLERLAMKGCVIRKTHKWHAEGYWGAVDNPPVQITPKGELYAMQPPVED
jgi:hypothetical protein